MNIVNTTLYSQFQETEMVCSLPKNVTRQCKIELRDASVYHYQRKIRSSTGLLHLARSKHTSPKHALMKPRNPRLTSGRLQYERAFYWCTVAHSLHWDVRYKPQFRGHITLRNDVLF